MLKVLKAYLVQFIRRNFNRMTVTLTSDFQLFRFLAETIVGAPKMTDMKMTDHRNVQAWNWRTWKCRTCFRCLNKPTWSRLRFSSAPL